jgi:hypothetical protein
MSAYSDAILATSGIRGYWRANEPSGTAMIDSANGIGNMLYDGGITLGNPALLPADAGTSLFNSGSQGRAVLNHNSNMNFTTSMTILAWIKPTLLKTHHVLGKWDAYGIVLRGSIVGWGLAGIGEVQTPSNSVVANNIYMVAGTYNGTVQNVYINGVLVASATRSGQGIQQNTFSLEAGSIINTEHWAGNMAHLAIFDSALSEAAIQNLFVLGAQTQPEAAGLSAQVYPFSRQVVAANPARTKLTIWNDSDTTVYLSLGGGAAIGSGPRLNGNGDRWTTATYTGAVSAIHGGYLGGKNITISEE